MSHDSWVLKGFLMKHTISKFLHMHLTRNLILIPLHLVRLHVGICAHLLHMVFEKGIPIAAELVKFQEPSVAFNHSALLDTAVQKCIILV